jgi:hypothetical protein
MANRNMSLADALHRLDEILQQNHQSSEDLGARIDDLQVRRRVLALTLKRIVLPKGKMVSATMLDPEYESHAVNSSLETSELQRENHALRAIIKVGCRHMY